MYILASLLAKPGFFQGAKVQVNILEAKNRLSQLVKSAQSGEPVVIANRGQPVAMLVGTRAGDAAGDAAPAPGGGVVAWLGSHPLPVHARRSEAELDAALAEERAAWD